MQIKQITAMFQPRHKLLTTANYTIFPVAPAVQISTIGYNQRMSTAAGNLRNWSIRQGFNALGTGFSSFVAVS